MFILFAHNIFQRTRHEIEARTRRWLDTMSQQFGQGCRGGKRHFLQMSIELYLQTDRFKKRLVNRIYFSKKTMGLSYYLRIIRQADVLEVFYQRFNTESTKDNMLLNMYLVNTFMSILLSSSVSFFLQRCCNWRSFVPTNLNSYLKMTIKRYNFSLALDVMSLLSRRLHIITCVQVISAQDSLIDIL